MVWNENWNFAEPSLGSVREPASSSTQETPVSDPDIGHAAMPLRDDNPPERG